MTPIPPQMATAGGTITWAMLDEARRLIEETP